MNPKGIPMAKFYAHEVDGVKIKAKPKAGRIFNIIPYRSDTHIPFRIEIKYLKEPSDDYREFSVHTNAQEIGKVHEEDNLGERYLENFVSPIEHDDKEQIITINFPRKASSYRLIRSVPLSSNFWFATIVTAGVAVIFALSAPSLITFVWEIIKTSLVR